MRRRVAARVRGIWLAGVVVLWPAGAGAQLAADAGTACRAAIRLAEAGSALPANLLGGIARVESGRRDPATGQVAPWPWTINAEGRGRFFDSKAEAIAAARELRGRGVQSFDVGCLQVNMMHHPDAFASLEEAFDPLLNARYAIRFLQALKDKLGNWDDASAWYHSANPELGVPYRGRVMTAMAEEARQPAPPPVAMPDPVRPSAGFATAAFGGPLSRPGSVMFLPRTGVVMASAGQGMGGQGMAGRGLDAYRAMPVAIVGVRAVLAR